MAALKLTGIGKSYGNVEVLRDINLGITTGEFVVFVEPQHEPASNRHAVD